jgi:hypothetical protein
VKGGFYKELECMFGQFHGYYMKILPGDFGAQRGGYLILSHTQSESLPDISNDSWMGLVNFVTSKYVIAKSAFFLHHSIIRNLAVLIQ